MNMIAKTTFVLAVCGLIAGCNQSNSKTSSPEQLALCEGSARVAFNTVNELSTDEKLSSSATSNLADYKKNCGSVWELHQQRHKEVLNTVTELAGGDENVTFSNLVYYKAPVTSFESVAGQLQFQDSPVISSFSYTLGLDGQTWKLTGGSLESDLDVSWEKISKEIEPTVECVKKTMKALDMYERELGYFTTTPREPLTNMQSRAIKNYREACDQEWKIHEKNILTVQKLILNDLPSGTDAEFSNMVYYYPFIGGEKKTFGQVKFSSGPETYNFAFEKVDNARIWSKINTEWEKNNQKSR